MSHHDQDDPSVDDSETPDPRMEARLREMEAQRSRDITEAVAAPPTPREEEIIGGFKATMEGTPQGASNLPERAQPPVLRPGFRIPRFAAAAALLIGAGAAWFAYDLGQRSIDPAGDDPSTPIRMGDDSESDKDALVVKWSLNSVRINLGAGDLSTGWYEAELRLEAGGEVVANTEDWHSTALWNAALPAEVRGARSVYVSVKRVSDDGAGESHIIEEWSNDLALDDKTRE